MQIGSLEIQLLADLARLKKDMDDVKGLVSGAMSTIERSVGLAKTALMGLGGTLVGIGSIAAFKGVIDGVIEAKVQLQRLSIQTGASVESLSAIGAVSKLTSTSIGDVSSAINKMQKNLATGTEDAKGAATALKVLGISFDEFASMKADEQMLKLAKSLDQFQDGGGKTAALMMIMGKNAATLLPMFEELAKKNELVGKTTSESAREAEAYEKNLKRLAQAGDTWKRQMVDSMLPALEAVTKAMVAARKEGGFLASIYAGAQTFLTGDDRYKNNVALSKQTEELTNLQSGLTRMRKEGAREDSMDIRIQLKKIEMMESELKTTRAYRTVLNEEQSAQEAIEEKRKNRPTIPGDFGGKEKPVRLQKDPSDYDKFNKQTLELIGTLNAELDVNRKLTQAEKERAKFLTDVDLAKLTEKEKAFFKIRYGGIVAMQDEVAMREHLRHAQELDLVEQKKAADALLAYSGQLDLSLSDLAFQTALLGQSAEAQSRMTAMRRLDIEAQKALAAVAGDPTLRAQVIAQNEEAQARTLAGMDAQIAKQKELNASWQFGAKTALDEYLKQVEDVAGQTKQLMTNAFKGIEDALVSFATTGKLDFKRLANSIIVDMVRMQVQASITGPLSRSMNSSLAGGGGLFGGLLGGIKDLFSGSAGSALSNIGTVPGFANGGDPPVGRPYWVGENGRELRIDKTPGTIVPERALGGSTINFAPVYHIDASSDRASVYANVVRMNDASRHQLVDHLRQLGVIN